MKKLYSTLDEFEKDYEFDLSYSSFVWWNTSLINQEIKKNVTIKMISMKKKYFVFIFQLFSFSVFGQLDSDFLKAKKQADDCFARGDYACAKKQYEIALAINVNDSYCKKQLQVITFTKNTILTYSIASGFEGGMAIISKNGKYGFIDVKGKVIILPIYEFVNYYSEGLASVQKDKKWGFIDKNGNTIIPFIYNKVNNFSEGLVAVQKDGKWGYIDKKGNTVLPFLLENASSFSEGLAHVERNGKSGFIDKDGRYVFFRYFGGYFHDGLVRVVDEIDQSNKWGYLDKIGNVKIPFEYEKANDFSEGLAYVEKNGKAGFIDITGKVIIPFIYETEINNQGFSEGLCMVKMNEKYGFIDKKGATTIPFVYDDFTTAFSEGLAKVYKNKKDGYIDKTGNIVIPFIYLGALPFSEGLALVRKNEREFFINKKGQCVINCH